MIRFLAALAALLAVGAFGQGQTRTHQVPIGTPTFPTIGRIVCEHIQGCSAKWLCEGEMENEATSLVRVGNAYDLDDTHDLMRRVNLSGENCSVLTTGFVDVLWFTGLAPQPIASSIPSRSLLVGMVNPRVPDEDQCGNQFTLELSCPASYSPGQRVNLDVSVKGTATAFEDGYRYEWTASQGRFENPHVRRARWIAPEHNPSATTRIGVRVRAREGCVEASHDISRAF